MNEPDIEELHIYELYVLHKFDYVVFFFFFFIEFVNMSFYNNIDK